MRLWWNLQQRSSSYSNNQDAASFFVFLFRRAKWGGGEQEKHFKFVFLSPTGRKCIMKKNIGLGSKWRGREGQRPQHRERGSKKRGQNRDRNQREAGGYRKEEEKRPSRFFWRVAHARSFFSNHKSGPVSSPLQKVRPGDLPYTSQMIALWLVVVVVVASLFFPPFSFILFIFFSFSFSSYSLYISNRFYVCFPLTASPWTDHWAPVDVRRQRAPCSQ